MHDTWTRFLTNLFGRLTGPLTFRLILQPTVVALYAIRDGLRDARAGRPAYFWTLFTHAGSRPQLIEEGLLTVFRVILLGIVMDVIYQVIVSRWVYPMELVVTVFTLAILPYVAIRGPANRIARRWIGPAAGRTRGGRP